MAKDNRKTKAAKVKKKKWYTILSPKNLGSKPLGETYVSDAESAIGKTINVNLMNLTGDIKNQNSNVKFEVTDVHENKLGTKVVGYTFSSSSIKRYVRRKMSRIDDSIVIRTKDGKLVRIKPFALTRNTVSKAVQYAVRAMIREELINIVRSTDYEELFNAVIRYQLQRDLKSKLSVIYPLRSLEIRILQEELKAPESAAPSKKVVRKAKKKEEDELKKVEKEKKKKEEQPEDLPVEEEQLEEKVEKPVKKAAKKKPVKKAEE